MSLVKKFTTVFRQQVNSLGLIIEQNLDEDVVIASNHEKYLKLNAYFENSGGSRGSGRVAIGELLLIKGNVKKALDMDLFPMNPMF